MMNKIKSAVGSAFNRGDNTSHVSNSKRNTFASRDLLPFHKYSYSRPDFLGISVEEYSVVLDKTERPIIVPRNLAAVPGYAGYAEAVNAGKSKLNEDQAQTYILLLHGNTHTAPKMDTRPADLNSEQDYSLVPPATCEELSINTDPRTSCQEMETFEKDISYPLVASYFGLFDGHAGPGAALFARHMLHLHIKEKLHAILPLIHQLLQKSQQTLSEQEAQEPVAGFSLEDVTTVYHADLDELVVGALEDAFLSLDNQLERELDSYMISGGCTALVALGFLGKLYVANAGDCRAVLVRRGVPIVMSTDFTPQADRERIYTIAKLCPHLMGNEFHHLEFTKRINRRDIGKKVLYRHSSTKGWATKIATEDDLKFPLVYGEGKRTRLMQTIGVARGFGDFTLRFYETAIHVKPFMTAQPEVKIFNPKEDNLHEATVESRNIESEYKIDDVTREDQNNSDDVTREDQNNSDDGTREDQCISDDVTKEGQNNSDGVTREDLNNSDDVTRENQNNSDDVTVEDQNNSDDVTAKDPINSDDVIVEDQSNSDDATASSQTNMTSPLENFDLNLSLTVCSKPDFYPPHTKKISSKKPTVRSPSPVSHDDVGLNDVLIIGSDGLWDVCSVEQAAGIVNKSLSKSKTTDVLRFTIAAQELVMFSRGTLQNNNWVKRDSLTASGDDITAFVIPLTILINPPIPS